MIQNKGLRIAIGCHQKAAASHLRAKSGVFPLRAYLELCYQQFYAPQSPNRHLPSPDPRSLRATLHGSYHRILRGLRLRGGDTNAPPLIFVGVLEEGAYPLARCIIRG